MRALTFFRVVPLHSAYMLIGLAALGVFGVAELAMDPGRGMDVAVPVMLLQMFAVSSGFSVPARRGHFDALLTGGSSRLQVALIHWLVSIAPGIAVWLVLGLSERAFGGMAGGGGHGAVFSSGSIVAMLLISILGWAITVPLPRLSGGVIWLVALFVALAFSGNWRDTLLEVARSNGNPWSLGVMSVVCPLLLVGSALEPADLLGLVPVIAGAVLALAAAIAWIERSNVSLEASQ